MLSRECIQRVLNDHARQTLENLKGESDRGAALVAAAYCDELLKTLLVSVFTKNEALSKRLLGGSLSGFAARNDLARALGLTRDKEFRALRMLNKIRNRHAAHSAKDFSFADPGVKALCVEMVKGDDRAPDWSQDDRDVFLSAAARLIGTLSGHVGFYTSIKQSRPNDALLEILAPWPDGGSE